MTPLLEHLPSKLKALYSKFSAEKYPNLKILVMKT
jgi:hypothetical protein